MISLGGGGFPCLLPSSSNDRTTRTRTRSAPAGQQGSVSSPQPAGSILSMAANLTTIGGAFAIGYAGFRQFNRLDLQDQRMERMEKGMDHGFSRVEKELKQLRKGQEEITVALIKLQLKEELRKEFLQEQKDKK